ncbi:hypothetical protein RI129_005944 [Pyrocoelia pectoralis]|uniref:Metalloendopeptidase n=1 Tax=Pyrocoelia pectoralis TaxID=417401 RepID=A0AAN7VJB2_9COLE
MVLIAIALLLTSVNANPLIVDDHNLWQRSGKFEGDMVLAPWQKNGVIDTTLRWPHRNIPYEISDVFGMSLYLNNDGDATGCWAQVGRLGGRQELNLQTNGCVWNHTIVHEFLHAAGFYHQQSSVDRDEYVTIFWENILEGMAYNFDKYNADFITSFNESYDYASIMHYGMYAFTSNNKPTILPKYDASIPIGVTSVMSEIDIRKLNKMYECI